MHLSLWMFLIKMLFVSIIVILKLLINLCRGKTLHFVKAFLLEELSKVSGCCLFQSFWRGTIAYLHISYQPGHYPVSARSASPDKSGKWVVLYLVTPPPPHTHTQALGEIKPTASCANSEEIKQKLRRCLLQREVQILCKLIDVMVSTDSQLTWCIKGNDSEAVTLRCVGSERTAVFIHFLSGLSAQQRINTCQMRQIRSELVILRSQLNMLLCLVADIFPWKCQVGKKDK